MAKNKTTTKYVCQECGSISPQWLGRCPMCGKFGSLVEEIEEEVITPVQKQKAAFTRPVSLKNVENTKLTRISSGIKEFDTVLGGGIVPYSMVLVGGDPGIGKSTLLSQVAGNLAKQYKVLYCCAEESCSQVKLRCVRLNIDSENLMLFNENVLENVLTEAENYDMIIIDSIQAIYLDEMNSSAGSIGQVKECASRLMRLAKNSHKTVFIVGHVTKDGAIAGPKVLEHIMDTVLYFEGESQDNYRILRAVKNRFGSAQEMGVFEMTSQGIFGVSDYNGIFLSENRGKEAGSVVTPSLSGNRCMLVELQSLLSKSIYGMPRRMPLGIDYNKLVVMLAVMEKKAYIPLYNQDVYINAMGGIKINEPSVDLAIILSVASAYKGIPVPKTTSVFGEVGLTGEIRGVNMAEQRINECIKYGFKKVIIPYKNNKGLEKYADKITIVPVKYVSQAIKAALEEDLPAENQV